MKNTVVIFNAGIGALTLGFQNAGYEILKAYEPDRKVIEIYQENISQNVTACSLSSIDPATVPDSDVWAFDLTQSKAEEVFYSLTLVQRRRPPVILFVMKKQLWKGFIKEHIFQLQEYGYHITHKKYPEFGGYCISAAGRICIYCFKKSECFGYDHAGAGP